MILCYLGTKTPIFYLYFSMLVLFLTFIPFGFFFFFVFVFLFLRQKGYCQKAKLGELQLVEPSPEI